MSTPILMPTDQEPQRPLPDEGSSHNSLTVWLLRVVSALIIPVILVAFFVTFEFLQDPGTNKLLQVVIAVVVGVGGVWLLYWGMDRTVSLFPERAAAAVRPAVFAGPAMILLSFFLVYPAVDTVITSLRDSSGERFVGLANYQEVFTSSQYLISIRNSVGWAIVVPAICVVVGLAFATLADKLGQRAEAVSKSLIFLPMAVSFVGASVVWTFIYSFRSEGFGEQIGILNGIWVAFGNEPVQWLATQPWNNVFLMVILIWLQTGFAMVVLSSAIKSVPEDLLEAARIDGATEWNVFRRIVIPSIASTIIVVWTTVLIMTWKVFDIVWVMTGGRDGTAVLAQQMVQEFFTFRDFGIGATLAVLLFVAVVPILIINVRRFREQEAMR
ncbi:MAG TPA: sugar ABC transporter permease [Acidimicrobiia bacterium]|nr:sugar ABC transporter permease [Acidimicrobiia bacterium]